MDFSTILIGASLFWLSIQFLNFFTGKRRYTGTGKIPPGPIPFPIVGNLFTLGNRPHESLANLSKTHGPLMTLQLGRLTTVIVSSAEVAKEVLHKNDQAFATRPTPDAARALGHHKFSMGWIPPASNQWRNLRKLCNSQLFSTYRLDDNQTLRRQKVRDLLDYVRDTSRAGGALDIGGAAFTTTFNLLSNTIFSVDLVDPDSGSAQEIRDVVWLIMEEMSRSNPVDYFPLLRSVDPLGIRRRLAIYFGKVLEIFDGMIGQRLESRASDFSRTSGDVLDALLDHSEEISSSEFGSTDIKHLDLFLAGTETTSTTLEWATAELLYNPDKMAKAKMELLEKIGKHKQVEESDIAGLTYLQAVVKETFRLHPAVPLLLPHKAESNVDLCGYTVPKDAQVLINVWAIGCDPSTWVNPNSFVPERFLESDIDVRGRHCELIPFGAGRRMCPGMPLGLWMLNLMLAILVHSFDWKFEDGLGANDLDMRDKFGVTLSKAEPLRAIPILV